MPSSCNRQLATNRAVFSEADEKVDQCSDHIAGGGEFRLAGTGNTFRDDAGFGLAHAETMAEALASALTCWATSRIKSGR